MTNKNVWGVVVGKPTEQHPNPNMARVGKMIRDPELFQSKEEAEACAKMLETDNPYWYFHAAKSEEDVDDEEEVIVV